MTEDNGLSSLLQRIQWREAIFGWLKGRSQFTDFDLDSCLSKLEENPVLREAALAAFWGTYLANELPAALSDPQEQQLRSLLERVPSPDLSFNNARDLAFVKLHLAGLLAICLIRPDCPISENPSVADMLEKALASHRLLEESSTVDEIVSNPSDWGPQHFHQDLFTFSLVLLGGIARTEVAFWHKERGEFEDAFWEITNAAWDICATTITPITDLHTGESIRNGFEPYLPHSSAPFNIQEVADIFEKVKKHPRNIDKWDRIEDGCVAIRYLGFCALYSSLDDVTDASGDTFVALEYWGKGITFVQGQRQAAEFPISFMTKDMLERMETSERLKRDFLRDLWNEMDKKTQDILVDAEIQWMHGRPDNMVKDLRPMLELILPSVFPFLKPTANQHDDHLILTRMRDALQKNRMVQASIDGLKLNDCHKTMIKHLPVFLQKVIDARNYFEKEQHQPRGDARRQSYIETATAIRDELLGIRCYGVLRCLMEVKRNTRPKPKAGF
jgi:hypothetical protein